MPDETPTTNEAKENVLVCFLYPVLCLQIELAKDAIKHAANVYMLAGINRHKHENRWLTLSPSRWMRTLEELRGAERFAHSAMKNLSEQERTIRQMVNSHTSSCRSCQLNGWNG